jgi:hypothetical protein
MMILYEEQDMGKDQASKAEACRILTYIIKNILREPIFDNSNLDAKKFFTEWNDRGHEGKSKRWGVLMNKDNPPPHRRALRQAVRCRMRKVIEQARRDLEAGKGEDTSAETNSYTGWTFEICNLQRMESETVFVGAAQATTLEQLVQALQGKGIEAAGDTTFHLGEGVCIDDDEDYPLANLLKREFSPGKLSEHPPHRN